MMTRASQLNSRAYAILAKNWQCLVTVTTVEEQKNLQLNTECTIDTFIMAISPVSVPPEKQLKIIKSFRLYSKHNNYHKIFTNSISSNLH